MRFAGRKPDGTKGGAGQEKQGRVRPQQEVPGEETPAHYIVCQFMYLAGYQFPCTAHYAVFLNT
jgi:hypothetical protein